MITTTAIPLMVRGRLLVAARGVLRLRGVGRVAAAAATAVLGLAVLRLAVWRAVLAVGLLLRAAVGGSGVGWLAVGLRLALWWLLVGVGWRVWRVRALVLARGCVRGRAASVRWCGWLAGLRGRLVRGRRGLAAVASVLSVVGVTEVVLALCNC